MTPGLPPPFPVPQDQRLSYLWISLEGLSDKFATVTNLNQIHQTEDIYVGQSWRLRLGHSHPSLGATYRHWVADVAIGQTLVHTASTLVQHQASGFGRFETQRGVRVWISETQLGPGLGVLKPSWVRVYMQGSPVFGQL